jgi:haloalkane dehalogenase
VVVLVHGNPTSAHLYRYVHHTLVPEYRCIAPDLLGFGRSDAPAAASYRPAAHATRLEALLGSLDLTDITLVLHDWGGPIGLAYALRHPGTVRRLVLTNTWGWPLTHRPLVQAFSRLMDTPVGRIGIERLNAFPRLVMPMTTGRTVEAPPSWPPHYIDALDTPARRRACRILAHSLIAETPWLRALWTRRHRLQDRPALLCWGMADPAFGTEPTLRRWTAVFSRPHVRRFSNVGHYLPEELGDRFAAMVASFLRVTDLPSDFLFGPGLGDTGPSTLTTLTADPMAGRFEFTAGPSRTAAPNDRVTEGTFDVARTD